MFERKGLTTPEQVQSMKEELRETDVFEQVTEFINRKKGRNKFSGAIKIISFLLVFSTLLYVLTGVMIAKSKGEIPSVFGFYVFSVESASMEPTLMVGDLIFSKKVSGSKGLPNGTIVTFKDKEGRVITHRIIERTVDENGKRGYITKGDNKINSPDDEVLTPERIIAVFISKVPLT